VERRDELRERERKGKSVKKKRMNKKKSETTARFRTSFENN
jgi:hypothetical protein